MPSSIDPELRPHLARAALDGLDHMLSIAPPSGTISFAEISAHVRMIKTLCPCGTSAAPDNCRRDRRL